jgi:hypothetical protein
MLISQKKRKIMLFNKTCYHSLFKKIGYEILLLVQKANVISRKKVAYNV